METMEFSKSDSITDMDKKCNEIVLVVSNNNNNNNNNNNSNNNNNINVKESNGDCKEDNEINSAVKKVLQGYDWTLVPAATK